jgi:isochorismate synthase
MQLLADGYRLYAGGGLLPESQMQQEWNETEAKMEAMRQLIR